MKTYKKLTDESIFPWGKHKGKEMQSVPASYLIWLEGEVLKINEGLRTSFHNGLLVYMNENRDVIESEAKSKKMS